METRDYKTLREQSQNNTFILGTSATTIAELMIRQLLDDIHANLPVVFIDSTGEYNDEILKHIPKNRQEDVIVFDPAREPFALNIFDNILGNRRDMVASTLSETLKGLWFAPDASTPVFDMYLRATLQTALSVSNTTFFSLKYILTNKKYRNELLDCIDDPVIKDFWSDYETLTPKEQRQDRASTINKLNAFAFSPLVRNCLDQKHNKIVFKDKIVLVSLRPELGTENGRLLGALILALLYVENTPQNLYLFGSSFGTAILGKLLTSCPAVRTVLAVQYLDQLSKAFKPALLGGVRTIVTLRTSNPDADYIRPYLNIRNGDLGTNEIAYNEAYVCQDGVTCRVIIDPHSYPETHQTKKILDRCKSQYTAPLATIENRIARFQNV